MSHKVERNAELRQMLSERRRRIQNAVQNRVRDERSARSTDVVDDIERSDADSHGDITFSLLQLRAEALSQIDEALAPLVAGQYGSCAACDGEISEPRLRAMPFAVRCEMCERIREEAAHARQLSRRRDDFSTYREAVGS